MAIRQLRKPAINPVLGSANAPQPLAGYQMQKGQYVGIPDMQQDPTIAAQGGGQIAVPRPYGGNLSSPVVTGGSAPPSLSASEYNDWQSQHELQYNTQAANDNAALAAYQIQQNQLQNAQGQQTSLTQKAYHALGNAMGVDTNPHKAIWDEATQKYYRPKNQPPNFDQLKGMFYNLPTDQQAQIYQNGGAQFIDPDSGAKLIQGAQQEKQKAWDTMAAKMGERIANGEVFYDSATNKMYQNIVDPQHPEAGLKQKIELSPDQYMIAQYGMKRGLLPDLIQHPDQVNAEGDDNYDQLVGAKSAPTNTPQAVSSSGDAATDAGRKLRALVSPSPVAPLGPTNANGDPWVTQTGRTVDNTNPYPPVSSFVQDVMNNVGTDAMNVAKAAYNIPAMGSNAALRFINGLTGINGGQIPIANPSPSSPLSPNPPAPLANSYIPPKFGLDENGKVTINAPPAPTPQTPFSVDDYLRKTNSPLLNQDQDQNVDLSWLSGLNQ